jgi:protein-disulfide isomerase
MSGPVRIVIASLAVALLVGPAPGRAEDPPSPASRAGIEAIVREYILKHPEVILESMQGMQERKRAAAREQASQRVAARQDDLLRDPAAPVEGNLAGDVTVVEFFDYRCPHCRSVAGTVDKLVESDPRIRLVHKQFPVLGPDSVIAARAALAARAQGKYLALHRALMSAAEPFTAQALDKLALEAGLDLDRLRADMEQPAIQAAIDRNRALAQDLGITGTPTFVVGAQIAPGAMSLEVLQALVAEARVK